MQLFNLQEFKQQNAYTEIPADRKRKGKPNISGKYEMHKKLLGNTGQVRKNQPKISVQESGAGGARGWEMAKGVTGKQMVSPK